MPMRPNILCVGSDRESQSLRRDMLEAAGYEVRLAAGVAEAVLAADEDRYDVAVICESLSTEEGDKLSHAISLISPNTTVLRQSTNGGEPGPSLATRDDLEVMVRSVRACLLQRIRAARRANRPHGRPARSSGRFV